MSYVEIADEALFVSLAGLSQESSNGLVDEVVSMLEQDVGNGISIVQLMMPEELHCADDADALFPYRLAITGKVVENSSVFVEQPCSQQFVTGEIYKIPIIDAVGMTKVKVDAFPLLVGVLLVVLEQLN